MPESDFDTVNLSDQGKKTLRDKYRSLNLTQDKLADLAKTSLDSVKRLLGSRKPEGVQRYIAKSILSKVGLRLEDLLESDDTEIVNKVRGMIREKIIQQCAKMRILSMSQPISLNQIYTRVNILENIPSRQRRELSELLDNLSSLDSERFTLGCITEERVPGLEAVIRYEKLMILGKPGAGKTTFLKYLAMQSIEGECIDLQCLEQKQSEEKCQNEYCKEKQKLKQLAPFFISLKEFGGVSEDLDLLTYIEDRYEIPKNNIQSIFNSGRAICLLDGLDEVTQSLKHQVISRIQEFLNTSSYFKRKRH